MKPSKKYMAFAIGILASLAIVMATVAEAQPARRADRRAGRPPHMMDCKGGPSMFFGNPSAMKQSLGLTDAQISRVEAVNLDHRKQLLEYKEKIGPKETHVKRLLLEDNPNLSAVRSTLREISDLRIEVQMLKITHRLEIEKVLTAEQKTKLKAIRSQHRKMCPGPHYGRPGY